MRLHPILKVYKMHTGVDIGVPSGSKVVAANAGKVLKAVYDSAYGNYILIDHGGGKATLYAHLSRFKVKSGDTVTRGQLIALSGSTGYSTGPHLHFEIRINGKTVDPMTYFK
jgi:murein DD-endopeptidase MepM/ murein hydrolase activator NlpD